MDKQKKLIFFLGQLKATIESLTLKASENSSELFEELSELESFFNKNMHTIFEEDLTGQTENGNINKKISGTLEIIQYGHI